MEIKMFFFSVAHMDPKKRGGFGCVFFFRLLNWVMSRLHVNFQGLEGLNSHCLPAKGDGHQPNCTGLHTYDEDFLWVG